MKALNRVLKRTSYIEDLKLEKDIEFTLNKNAKNYDYVLEKAIEVREQAILGTLKKAKHLGYISKNPDKEERKKRRVPGWRLRYALLKFL